MPNANLAATQLSPINLFTVENGLSQMTVSDIAQDKNGNIWLATQVGLDRFDGYDFKSVSINSQQSQANVGVYVRDIEVHPDTGDLWIGTLKGIKLLRAIDGNSIDLPIQLPSPSAQTFIQDIQIDPQGNIWMTTNDTVYLWSEQEFQFLSIMEPSEKGIIYQIIHEKLDYLLVVTNSGIFRVNKSTFKWSEPLVINSDARYVFIDRADNLWIGTNGKGLLKTSITDVLQNIAPTHVNQINGLVGDVINHIMQTKNGDIWLATNNGIGIIRDPQQYPIRVDTVNEFAGNTIQGWDIRTLYEGQNGSVFFGTLSNGFGVIDINSILFDHMSLGENEIVYALTREDENNLWVAASNGVFKLNANMQITGPFNQLLGQEGTVLNNKITGLHYSVLHQKLFLLSRIGLLSLDQQNNVIVQENFAGKPIYSIAEDQNGNLWLGFDNDGIYQYNPKTKKIINQWPAPLVVSLFHDKKGMTFAATVSGLYKFDGMSDQPTIFKKVADNSNSIHHDVVTFVTQIGNNKYILGTQGQGLSLMTYDEAEKDYVFRHILPDEEISTLSIGTIVQDRDKNFWLTTTKGIVKISSEFDEIEYFSAKDGVQTTGFFINSYSEDSDERIYFGGPQGITYFYPQQIVKSVSMPKLHITDISTLDAEDKSYSLAQSTSPLLSIQNQFELRVKPNNLLINIEFAANEYSDPSNIEYAFKLEGFDNQWRTVKNQNRVATYTNLDSGDYVFKLKSTNKYGVWGDNPISFDIVVETPWWKTGPAIFIWILLLLIVPFIFYKWRVATHKNRSKQLSALVDEKTLDLKNAVAQLKRLSIHDPLTDILNRRGFKEAAIRVMSEYQRESRIFTIALIDIDFFKNINDKFGHDVGDQLLVQISQLMQKQIRSHDILARWGGEEFILLMPNTDLDSGLLAVNKVRQVIAATEFIFDQNTITTSVSVGVNAVQEHESVEAIIKDADTLLYKAKEAGRNSVLSVHGIFYSP